MPTDTFTSSQKAPERWLLFWWYPVPATLLGAVLLCFWLCSETAASMCGSGFVIQQNGYILTNYHVIKKATRITITVPGREAVSARLVTTDQEKDLAILQVSLRNLTALPIASSDTVQVLDSVTVLGYPLPSELGTALSASDGKVNAVREGHSGGTRLFQIDANVNPGNSGGPLLNNHGEVVGIVVAKINSLLYAKENGALPERINFAIPINDAQALLRKVIPDFTPSNRQEVLTDQQVFQSAKGSTVLIVADQDETGSTTYSENEDNGSLARFIAEFVRAGESGSGEGQTDYYASPCDYFENGQCTHESILRELQDYNHKWPSRQYQLLGTPLVNATNQGKGYEVSFKVSFTVRNRGKAVSGVCYFRAQVVRSEDGFLITAIREKFATEGS
ncbi:MAG: trypsin-like peptidase domain-containing protein [Verrucomicrobia bacterium]|nr:trypsin-like peptidase domain-containing protein [Verrucomicrobiota bacterium]